MQPVAETGAFNAQVAFHGSEFGRETGDGLFALVERVTQIVGELPDHGDGGVRVRTDFRGDAIERVEKKMRVELGAEHLQFHTLGVLLGFRAAVGFARTLGVGPQPVISEAPHHEGGPHDEETKSDVDQEIEHGVVPSGPKREGGGHRTLRRRREETQDDQQQRRPESEDTVGAAVTLAQEQGQ